MYGYCWVFFAVFWCWMGATDFEWEDGLVDYFVQILVPVYSLGLGMIMALIQEGEN